MGIGFKGWKMFFRELVKYMVILCISLVVFVLLYIFINMIVMNIGFLYLVNYNE